MKKIDISDAPAISGTEESPLTLANTLPMGHTQNAIADIISQKHRIPVRTTRLVLQEFLDIAAEDIIFTGNLRLRGLGTFAVTTRPPVTVSHPQTGKPTYIPQKKVVQFRTSLAIKRRLNPKKTAQRTRRSRKKTTSR